MLNVVIGTDKSTILNFLKSHRKKYKNENVLEVAGKESTYIRDSFYSMGLFGTKRLVVVRPKSISEIDFDESFLTEVKASSTFGLFIEASKINKNTKVYKLLKKQAVVNDFSEAKDYTYFNLLDALFIEKNKKKAINLLGQVRDLKTNSVILVAIFQNALRNFISMKENNETWKTVHPFVKIKTKRFTINKKQAIGLYAKLIEIDLKSKSTNANVKALWEDFMLYSI